MKPSTAVRDKTHLNRIHDFIEESDGLGWAVSDVADRHENGRKISSEVSFRDTLHCVQDRPDFNGAVTVTQSPGEVKSHHVRFYEEGNLVFVEIC